MKITSVSVTAEGEKALAAAGLFREELSLRGISESGGTEIVFRETEMPKDDFEAADREGRIVFRASSLRGFIYAYSRFFRKLEKRNGGWFCVPELFGSFSPKYRFRGHQFGYRPKNNTCDAWGPKEFRRAFLDTMAFGSNIAEIMPGGTDDGERNGLMRWSENEMLFLCSEEADRIDIDVSVWYPNCEKSTPEESAELRGKIFEKMKRLNFVFPPGGDPGDYPAGEFLDRAVLASRKMAESHPEAQMWPSAQKPKGMPGWGNDFIEYLEKCPGEIAGVVTGPNEAMDIDTLRRRLPAGYPLRYYPDITHNVRCTFPVHHPRDDWHYAMASTLGRESINPRPLEYRHIHRLVSRYCEGSVSYSEGSNDDVNKAVWGALDWDPETPITEILEDYARFFMPGAKPSDVADGILGLEHNWIGDPAENPGIESTLALWRKILENTPELSENWRFVFCLFRAECDALVRRRRIFELGLVREAERLLRIPDRKAALEVLGTEYPESYVALREDLNVKAKELYGMIGIQLSVEEFHAAAPDRGATLDTIDRPVTNRAYLKKRVEEMTSDEDAAALLRHMHAGAGEYFFSVAEDTCEVFGGKPAEAYLNFKGDGDFNDGSVPMELIGIYDHYFFEGAVAGLLPETEYELRLVIPKPKRPSKVEMYVLADGGEIFRGDIFALPSDEEYDKAWLPESYCSKVFTVPAKNIKNGCVRLRFGEDRYGIEFAEFRLTPKTKGLK